jgi:hypothetical protein
MGGWDRPVGLSVRSAHWRFARALLVTSRAVIAGAARSRHGWAREPPWARASRPRAPRRSCRSRPATSGRCSCGRSIRKMSNGRSDSSRNRGVRGRWSRRLAGSHVRAELAGLAVLATLAAPSPAGAHLRSGTVAVDYGARVFDSQTAAYAAQIFQSDRALSLAIKPGHVVILVGYLGEPVFRLDAAGLWVNAASPTAVVLRPAEDVGPGRRAVGSMAACVGRTVGRVAGRARAGSWAGRAPGRLDGSPHRRRAPIAASRGAAAVPCPGVVAVAFGTCGSDREWGRAEPASPA